MLVRAFSPWSVWRLRTWGCSPGWYNIAPLALDRKCMMKNGGHFTLALRPALHLCSNKFLAFVAEGPTLASVTQIQENYVSEPQSFHLLVSSRGSAGTESRRGTPEHPDYSVR